jgi:hypothetical protein
MRKGEESKKRIIEQVMVNYDQALDPKKVQKAVADTFRTEFGDSAFYWHVWQEGRTVALMIDHSHAGKADATIKKALRSLRNG